MLQRMKIYQIYITDYNNSPEKEKKNNSHLFEFLLNFN